MPLKEYFHGGGEKVMKNMKRQYGEKKGEEIFYRTANKRKMKPSRSSSRKAKR